jgi:hypothetical protein
MNSTEKILYQYRTYKHTGEIEIQHITDEIYDVLKNKVTETNAQILNPAFEWKVMRFTKMINSFTKPEQREVLVSEIKRLLYYVSNEEIRNVEFINSCKEFKLKLFYDKFDNIEALKTELTKIFQ